MDNLSEKHLHVVSFDIPFPANYGGVVDVFYKIKELSEKGIKVHLHCFEYGRKHSEELENICYSVQYYKRDLSKVQILKNLPYIVSSRYSEELIVKLMKDKYPILLEGLHTCYVLLDKRMKNRKIFVRTHNVEHDYYLNLALAERSFYKKYYYNNEAKKLQRFENILSKASGLIAISIKDYDYFSKRFQNVTFIPAFHPHKVVKSKMGKGKYVLYHGNLSVAENYNAVEFLLKNVFDNSNINFKIAGLKPPSHLKKMVESNPNVELIADPTNSELYKLIQKAHINISVTFQDTGLKLKLLNTLYNGRFCLVNDKMLSGTALDDLCVVANNPTEISDEINRLFELSFTEKDIELRKEKLALLYNNGNNVNELISLMV